MMERLTDEEKFLLLGKMTGSLSPEEEVVLDKLLKDNPDAQAAYEELEHEIPVEDKSAYFASRKEEPTWRDITQEFREQAAGPEVKRLSNHRRTWTVAAIFIGVLIGGAVLMFILYPFRKADPPVVAFPAKKAGIELTLADGKVIDLSSQQGLIDGGNVQLNNADRSLSYSLNDNSSSGRNVLTVPIGMDYKINLADGSEVWLNSSTKVEFPLSFSGKTREIRIDGEAYIKVTKDASRPFIVHLPQSSVQVLGTEFNVNTYDKGVEKVALVEGAVDFKTMEGECKIVPGNQAIYTKGDSIKQETFDPKYVLSWRKGLYYFNDATLAEISKVVPRWYGIQLTMEDPGINNRRFTGVINRNRPISLFLEDLKIISRIDAWFDKDSTLHLK